MSMNVNENNRIECNYPMLFVPETKKYYLDWSSFCTISGQASTCLYRILKLLPDVTAHQYRYKNRVYWEVSFVLGFWKRVAERPR
ncbi:MAG: hypothetical protein IT233_08160 [Bacteroidia bacterium]|nr:hypothetical protein [Bacteroidia bacterium]